jgi:hypothetical protein
MKIDWNTIPCYTFNVSALTAAYDICRMMNKAKINKYVYEIMWKGVVIKYGMSADNSRTYGERLYRQIGHSKSWGIQRLVCSSGSDWRIIEEDFETLYGVPLDKDNLKVKIWDASNYMFETINPWDEVYYMEQELIRKYSEVVGQKPIGNINDDKNIMYKARIKKSTWEGLFTDEA